MLARPIPQATDIQPLPAPLGGINTIDPLMGMSPADCVQMLNFVPREYGLQMRKGYAEHTHTFTAASTEVRTIISFQGTLEDGSQDKIFATTLEGIYDVTAAGAAGTLVAWASKTGNAGYCQYVTFTSLSEKYLFVCDEVNGLYRYNPSGGWVKITTAGASAIVQDPTVITTCDPTKFSFVTVWKNRLWFIESNSGYAWYLPVGAFQTGAAPGAGTGAKLVEFGNKFALGGFLSGLYNYTFDGGVGIDDFLVAISSAGDVLLYQGVDPTVVPSQFSIVGTWKIGEIPVGRRYAVESGGDLYILCSYGVISLNQLIKGVDPGAIPAYITGKITNIISKDLAALITIRGWQLINHPTEGVLIILVPTTGGQSPGEQYIMNISTRAWGKWTGIPMQCAAIHKNTLYLGTRALVTATFDKGGVFTLSGHTDLNLAGDSGSEITALLIPSFQYGKRPGAHSRLQFARPQFLAKSTPIYTIDSRYDFDVNDYISVPAGTLVAVSGTTWGTATSWGFLPWGEGDIVPTARTVGLSGMGRFMSMVLTVKAQYETTLIGFLVMYDQGGLL